MHSDHYLCLVQYLQTDISWLGFTSQKLLVAYENLQNLSVILYYLSQIPEKLFLENLDGYAFFLLLFMT